MLRTFYEGTERAKRSAWLMARLTYERAEPSARSLARLFVNPALSDNESIQQMCGGQVKQVWKNYNDEKRGPYIV